MTPFLVIPLLFLGVSSQFLNCKWVSTLDCKIYSAHKVCGTDGITYSNRCYFAKAQCDDNDLHILHDGDCLPSEASTPSPGVDGQQAVLDFFCINLSHQDCPIEASQEVCGTDGWTYPNYCEYEKARCTHRNLHVANLGPCP